MDALGRLYVAAGLNRANPPFETADNFKGGIYMIGCNFYKEMTAPNTGGKVWHRGYSPPPADILIRIGHFEAGVDSPGESLVLVEALHLGRQLLQALHTLERLQKTRTGEDVPPPAALDVTVNGEVPALPAARSAGLS